MKKVSGTLKLDLAQYRELEAFSQFASDLDTETKKQLDRGARMMELLKQGVYSPVPVEKQICSIYAGSKGYLDSVEVSKVGKFETDLYHALDDDKKVLESITKEKQITEDSEKKLKEIIAKVVDIYK
jgi:F-type H+-transporting ATPase subunit alpha